MHPTMGYLEIALLWLITASVLVGLLSWQRERRQTKALAGVLEQRKAELAALQQVAQGVAWERCEGSSYLLDLVLRKASKLLQVDAAVVWITDGQTGARAERHIGYANQMEATLQHARGDEVELCLRSGKPLWVDTTADEVRSKQCLCWRLGVSSALYAPISFRGKPLGTIGAYSRRERVFTDDEQRLLSTLADLAAATIYSDRTAAEIDDLLTRLAQPKEEVQIVGSTLSEGALSENSTLKVRVVSPNGLAGVGEKGVVGRIEVYRDTIREQEIERLKDEFVSVISHELRAPLTVLLGYSQKMRRELARGRVESAKEDVEKVLTKGKQLVDLINELLDLLRLQAGRLELRKTTINLGEVVTSVVSASSIPSPCCRVEIEKPADSIVLSADRSRLEQVLSNLLENAVKYSPQGGDIVVNVGRDDHNAVVSVRDKGIGIASEHLPHLFQRFSRVDSSDTRHFQGAGLGLYISRLVVEAHAGRIWAESEGEGQGSTFTFTLPLTRE